MYMNERKSGTNHVTAALAAEANAAPIGQASIVFEYKDKFGISITPATGDIYISSGAMIWNGRHCGISSSENVKYTPPESDTLYKKVVVAAQYKKDASTGIETVSLVALESETVETSAAAFELTMDIGSADISEATQLANFPLWRFVATATTHTEPVQLFDVQDNYSTFRKRINECAQEIANEVTKRKALEDKVEAMSKGVVQIPASSSGSGFFLEEPRKNFVEFILVFENGETMTIPQIAGSYKKIFYKIEGSGSLTDPTKATVGTQAITLGNITNVSITLGSSSNTAVCSPIKAVYGIR